jgi:bifunctional pyridoxal-dependent enzyme with beta-cystathionase and maltose regulon repressor activities
MGMFYLTLFDPKHRCDSLSLENRNAGFFIWIDLSPYISSKTPDTDGWKAEAALKETILEAGVEMASGFKYKEEKPGWFRVMFAVEKDALEEALQR